MVRQAHFVDGRVDVERRDGAARRGSNGDDRGRRRMRLDDEEALSVWQASRRRGASWIQRRRQLTPGLSMRRRLLKRRIYRRWRSLETRCVSTKASHKKHQAEQELCVSFCAPSLRLCLPSTASIYSLSLFIIIIIRYSFMAHSFHKAAASARWTRACHAFA